MEFVYADDLNRQFSVLGHFYDLKLGEEVFRCRNVLEILLKDRGVQPDSAPCAVVIMMNPGSSRPVDKSYVPAAYSVDHIFSACFHQELIPTVPDNAQYQIMRLMLLRQWKHVRVLNLSDLRNGNSGNFALDFKKAAIFDPQHPHSLTHEKRHAELFMHCKGAGAIIAAWGSTEVLRSSAGAMIRLLPRLQGIPLASPWFRYPSPYRKDQKMEWLGQINERLEIQF